MTGRGVSTLLLPTGPGDVSGKTEAALGRSGEECVGGRSVADGAASKAGVVQGRAGAGRGRGWQGLASGACRPWPCLSSYRLR